MRKLRRASSTARSHTSPLDTFRHQISKAPRAAGRLRSAARRGNHGVQKAADYAVRRAVGMDEYLSAAVDSNRRLLTALERLEAALRERDHEIARLKARIDELEA